MEEHGTLSMDSRGMVKSGGPQAPLTAELEVLEKELAVQRETIGQLAEALAPVLRRDEPQGTVQAGAPVRESSSALRNGFEMLHARVVENTQALRLLIQRVDL